uniref:RanBP2-type domain-containing protein n=1 Tax=uncultured bacterium contig00009 TaxID=1181501 RepID=A0A806KDW9_9BACT|nr:hypothetical protein [uncultured bacterium contig00009]
MKKENKGADSDATRVLNDDDKATMEGVTRREMLYGAIGAGITLAAFGCNSNEGNAPSSGSGSNASDSNRTQGTYLDPEQPSSPGNGSDTSDADADTGADADTDTDTDTGTDTDADTGKVHLAAACGTYCGACPAYIATHPEDGQIQYSNPWGECDGCLGGGRLAAHCRICDTRLCALRKHDDARCTDCEQLPCYRVTNLINQVYYPGQRGPYMHRLEYLPNLEKIREMGAEEWVKSEEARWRCPGCGLPMGWYDTECARCGEPRSERLFPVTRDTPRPY